jgi:hypothetical protein
MRVKRRSRSLSCPRRPSGSKADMRAVIPKGHPPKAEARLRALRPGEGGEPAEPVVGLIWGWRPRFVSRNETSTTETPADGHHGDQTVEPGTLRGAATTGSGIRMQGLRVPNEGRGPSAAVDMPGDASRRAGRPPQGPGLEPVEHRGRLDPGVAHRLGSTPHLGGRSPSFGMGTRPEGALTGA